MDDDQMPNTPREPAQIRPFAAMNTDQKIDLLVQAHSQTHHDLTALTAEVRRNHDEASTRFARLETGMDAMGARIIAEVVVLNRRIDSVETTVTQTKEHVLFLTGKVDELGSQVTELGTQVTELRDTVATLDAKVTELDGTVTALDAKVAALDTKVAALDTKVTALDTKVTALQAHAERVDERLDGVEKRLDGVEKRLGRLEERFDRVDDKLDEVLQRLSA